jgi:N-acetyltransferase
LKIDFKIELQGRSVSLIKFDKKHIDEIKQIASTEDIWKFNKASNTSISSFLDGYINSLISNMENRGQWSYVVVQNCDNKIIGSTRFYDISFSDKRLAIGFTWYHPSIWGTTVNPEVKLLLLQFAFEDLEFNRVEFHIDSRNERSVNAVKKLGATQEGLLRKHKIVQSNVVRDTVLCSIIHSEWPKIKEKLIDRISCG